MKIEFYLVDAFEVFHYEPIWRALKKRGIDARIVAIPNKDNRVQDKDWFDFDRATNYLKEHHIPFETETNFSAVGITTQAEYIIEPYKSLHIRLMYGLPVYPQSWTYYPNATKPFDAILVHGKYYQRYLSQWKSIKQLPIIGYPIYDNLFAKHLNIERLRNKWQLDSSKPTLLYLPTWADNSSFDLFFETISKLQSEFQIIIKPHHCTLRIEPKRMDAMRLSGVRIMTNAFDLPKLLTVADLVLTDARGGTLTEALVLEKKVIGLIKDPLELAQWIEPSGLTKLLPFVTEPNELRAQIYKTLEKNTLNPEWIVWAEDHVAFRDGTAGEQAAEAILKLIDEDNKHPERAVYRKINRKIRRILNNINRANPRLHHLRHPWYILKKLINQKQRIFNLLKRIWGRYELKIAGLFPQYRWKKAQVSEKLFWNNWFEENPTQNDNKWLVGTVLKYFEIKDGQDFGEEILVDIGSGPIGILTRFKSKNKIAVDPLEIDSIDKSIKRIKAPGENTTLESNFADKVFMYNVLQHVCAPEKILNEINRILKHGGTAYILEQLNLPTDIGHPSSLKLKIFENFLADNNIEIIKKSLDKDCCFDFGLKPGSGYSILCLIIKKPL